MGLKDALYILENAGLEVSFKGRGSVKKQSISPQDFAESLWDNANVLLLNRMIDGQDNQQIINRDLLLMHSLFLFPS